MTRIDRNAAESAFGWEFQINFGIVLALKNIKKMSSIVIEGELDDIEIELDDGNRIYCQVKAHYKANEPGNGSATRLKAALSTLADDLKMDDCAGAIYGTNDRLPFGKSVNSDNFGGEAFFTFGELEHAQQTVVRKYLRELEIDDDAYSLLTIAVLPFFGIDESTKMRAVDRAISEFLGQIQSVDARAIAPRRLRRMWAMMLGFDATMKPGTERKSVTKRRFVWPIVFEICETAIVNHEALDIDEDLFESVTRQYKSAIDAQSNLFSLSTRIITDYEEFFARQSMGNRQAMGAFVSESWERYSERLGADEICDIDERRAFVQLVLLKVLRKRDSMREVSSAVNLYN